MEAMTEDYEFGAKLARQLGADLSADHAEEEKDPKQIERETRMAEAARPHDWRAEVAGMSHDERVDATLACLERKNNQKEIRADLLEFCLTERTEAEAEAFLEAHKQFADGYCSANKHLLYLLRTGALDEIEYNEDGEPVTQEMREEALAAAEEADEDYLDPACEWRYLTTPAGQEALERFSPAARTRAMLSEQKASRHASFRRLLEFCETPRSLSEIVDFMKDDPGLEIDSTTGVMRMQPSAYIGKLDTAGALTWDNGWKTTSGGMEVLQTLTWE